MLHTPTKYIYSLSKLTARFSGSVDSDSIEMLHKPITLYSCSSDHIIANTKETFILQILERKETCI